MRFLTLFSLLFFTLLLAENKYYFTDEQSLKSHYFTKISPAFYKVKLQTFYTKENYKIAYKVFPVKKSKATVVISSGRTEGMVKYQELIYDFNQNGYSVYILDHRGQGYSQRLLEETQIGHIRDFENYVRDLKYFVDKVVPKERPRVLLAHSMGGTIASLYVEQYGRDFDALVLSSPMHQPAMLLDSLSPMICSIIQKHSKNFENYMIGMKSYDDTEHTFKNNRYTHSQVRYDIMRDAYEREPLTKIGGASVGWVAEACKWSKISVDNADKIKIPTLLLQAQKDKIVTSKAQREFCDNAGKYCQLEVIEGAAHEIFIEKDEQRNLALRKVVDFLAKTLH